MKNLSLRLGALQRGFEVVQMSLKQHHSKDSTNNISADIKSALEDMIALLDDLAHSTEDDFLTLGDELQGIFINASSLGNRISENIRVFDVHDGEGILARINLFTQNSHSQTTNALAEVEKLRHSLYGVGSLLDKILSNTDGLGRISMYLRVLGVYIGIECARKSHSGSIFSVVAGDTVVLAGKINEIIDNIVNHTTSAKRIQAASYTNTTKKFDQLQVFTKEAAQASSCAFQHVSELVERAVESLKRADSISQEITKEVGGVVMGIQFHDSLRQRIEHVIHALTDAVALLDRSQNEDKSVSDDDENRLGYALAIIEIQESQLDLLFHDTETLFEEQHRAFGRISQGISALTECLKDIGLGEQSPGKEGDSLLVLADTTKIIMDARSGSELLAREIKQTTERVFKVTSQLTGFVEETSIISHQIHLNALNSIIQAAQLDMDGKTLQVISQDMVAVSRQVETLVPTFMNMVGEIKELVSVNCLAEGEKQSLPDGMDIDPDKICQGFDDFKSNSEKLLEEGKALGKAAAGEQEKLVFLSDIIEKIQDYKAKIHGVVEDIRPLIGDGSQNGQIFSEELAQRYTMEQERMVHSGVLTADEQPSVSVPVAETPLDDIFFTDDLEELSGGGDASPPGDLVNMDDHGPNTLDTQQQTLPSVGHVSEDDKNNNDDSLGDNIELF